MPRGSTVLRNRAGKAVPPRFRLAALLKEGLREWKRISKRDNFESATCRELGEAVGALTRAVLIEERLRGRASRQRVPKSGSDDPQRAALRHLYLPERQ